MNEPWLGLDSTSGAGGKLTVAMVDSSGGRFRKVSLVWVGEQRCWRVVAVEVEQIRRHPISLGKEQKCSNIIHSFLFFSPSVFFWIKPVYSVCAAFWVRPFIILYSTIFYAGHTSEQSMDKQEHTAIAAIFPWLPYHMLGLIVGHFICSSGPRKMMANDKKGRSGRNKFSATDKGRLQGQAVKEGDVEKEIREEDIKGCKRAKQRCGWCRQSVFKSTEAVFGVRVNSF